GRITVQRRSPVRLRSEYFQSSPAPTSSRWASSPPKPPRATILPAQRSPTSAALPFLFRNRLRCCRLSASAPRPCFQRCCAVNAPEIEFAVSLRLPRRNSGQLFFGVTGHEAAGLCLAKTLVLPR